MAGMFEEKKEDDYVNSEAFPVVLSHKYYEDDGSSFINMLKLAIRKRYDEEVFGVIKDFYEFEGVIKVILDSKVPKYVSKIIKMPERLCDKLLKGDDDVDGKIKDFVSNNDNYSIYLEYVIVKSGNKFDFNSKKGKSELAEKAFVASKEIEELLEGEFISEIAQKKIIKTGNSYYISKLLDAKRMNSYGSFSPIVLSDYVQRLIVDNGNIDCILKLMERDDFCSSAVMRVARTGYPVLLFKLLEREDLHLYVQHEILESGNTEYILKLLDRKELSPSVKREIVKSGNSEFIDKLFNGHYLDSYIQCDIAESNNPELIGKLLEYDHSLDYEATKKIICNGSQEQLIKLWGRKDLYRYYRDEIRQIFMKNGWKLPEA